MKMNCYAVFDSKAKVYAQPFFVPTHGVAIRSFTDLANDPKTVIHRYPEDFSLFHIGEFDDAVGGLSGNKEPINLGLASTYLAVKPLEVSK